MRIRLEATWEKSSTIDGSIDSKISYITCPEAVEIEDVHRTNAARRDLDKIRVVYVPAVRDPSRQLKNASGTMMYQVMSSINWSEETKGNVKAKIKELNEQFEGEKGVSMFGTSLAEQWKAYDSLLIGLQMMFSFMMAEDKTPLQMCDSCDTIFAANRKTQRYCCDKCRRKGE